MGTAKSIGTKGNVCPRSSKPTGRHSKEFCIQQRMGSKPPNLFPHNQNLGDTGYRPGSDTNQHEMPDVSGESSLRIGRGHGLSAARLELPSGLHLSTDAPHFKVSTQTQEVRIYSDSSPPLLVEVAMVHNAPPTEYSEAIAAPNGSGFTLAGTAPSSIPGEAAPDSLEIERARFLVQDCS